MIRYNKTRVMRRATNKEKARQNALKDGNNILWQDPDGKWRAVKGPEHIPNWALDVEYVDGSTTLTF